MRPRYLVTMALVAYMLTTPARVDAQTLGTFRWQLLPYCNVLTLTVNVQGSNYTLDGTDSLCGAAQQASVSGLAFPNPDGSIGFGLTIVQPNAEAVHLRASISLASLSGTWTDKDGDTGPFFFLSGASVPGSPRPNRLTAPRVLTVPFDLAAGAFTDPIPVPDNIPVQLVGVTTTSGVRGVGHASLLSIPGATGFIEWVGLDSTAGAAITQGFSGATGAKILFIDFQHLVQVEVFGPGGSNIRVRNLSAGTRTGRITLTY